MALPKQVQDQLKALEEIEKQLTTKPAEPPADVPQDPPADPTPAEPTEPKPADPDPKPAEPKPAPTEPVADEKWEQKYKTLKGMYDAEVPRLHAELRELKAQMDQLRRSAEKPAEPTKPAQPTKLVTDEDVAAFGSDLIEVQRKVAREVASEFRTEIDELKAENQRLREQMTATDSKVGETTFEARLHRMIPDFAEVNVDPKWVEWLNEFDPIIRGPRKLLAQDAFNRGDAEAVADYVKLFKQSIAPVEPVKDKADELQRQVQPSRTSTSSATVPQKGKTYSSSQIQNMFQKAALLGAQGKHDEAKQLEAEIDAAYMEGRVTS